MNRIWVYASAIAVGCAPSFGCGRTEPPASEPAHVVQAPNAADGSALAPGRDDEVPEHAENTGKAGAVQLAVTLAYEMPEPDGRMTFFKWDTPFPPPARVGGRIWIEAQVAPDANVLLVASDISATHFSLVAHIKPQDARSARDAGDGLDDLPRTALPDGWSIDDVRAWRRSLTVVATFTAPGFLKPGELVTCDGSDRADDMRCRFLTQLDGLGPPSAKGLEHPWRTSLRHGGGRVDASKQQHEGLGTVAVKFAFATHTP